MNNEWSHDPKDIAEILAPWLLHVVDNVDWGYRDQGGHIVYNATNERLAAWRTHYWKAPQRLDAMVLASHLAGIDDVHYTSARGSGFALLCLDIDAHRGQTDAFEAAELLAAYFPGCYIEPTRRGYHIFILVHVGRIRRAVFNGMVAAFGRAAATFLDEHNIASTVEMKGTFTLYGEAAARTGDPSTKPRRQQTTVTCRAGLVRLPRPTNVAQARFLTDPPVYHVSHLKEFTEAWTEAHEYRRSLLDAIDIARESGEARAASSPDLIPVHLDENNAFHRMQIAHFDFTRRFGEEPADAEALNDFYIARWNADPGDADRLKRASWCLTNSRFDPAKAGHGGFEAQREPLLEAVSAFVHPEHKEGLSYKYAITDLDLAVALWVVTRVSFELAADKSKQFGCPNKRIIAAFDALRSLGLIDRGCKMSTKVSSIKAVLQRAGLIQCLDNSYFFIRGNPEAGRGKKYAIGPVHQRYAEWCSLRPLLESETGARLTPAAGILDETGARAA